MHERPGPRLVPAALRIRPMRSSDAGAVAAVHVESWQSAYRGIYTDAYLDGRAAGDRRTHWQERLAAADAASAGLVLEEQGQVVGFAYLIRDDDPPRGPLLDNLHVCTSARGRGLGRMLLAGAAREIVTRGWTPRLHLWVFEANAGARRFYERLGGLPIERVVYDASDGGAYPAWCYAWDDVGPLSAIDTVS